MKRSSFAVCITYIARREKIGHFHADRVKDFMYRASGEAMNQDAPIVQLANAKARSFVGMCWATGLPVVAPAWLYLVQFGEK